MLQMPDTANLTLMPFHRRGNRVLPEIIRKLLPMLIRHLLPMQLLMVSGRQRNQILRLVVASIMIHVMHVIPIRDRPVALLIHHAMQPHAESRIEIVSRLFVAGEYHPVKDSALSAVDILDHSVFTSKISSSSTI